MLKSKKFLRLSGLVLKMLISASVMIYSSIVIFGADKIKAPISTDLIYDPDYGLNITSICLFSKDVYKTKYYNSTCHNKTMIYWYNPWLRHRLWKEFWEEVEARKRLREIKLSMENATKKTEEEKETIVATESPVTCPEKPKQKPSEVLYAILVGLLILSAFAACWEVFRERLKRNNAADTKAQERECTLADFTINRHLRKESQQQQTGSHLQRQASFEVPSKVTQTLIHQSSLDRAFPKLISEVKSMEVRRNSVPSYLISNVQQSDKIISRNVIATPSKTIKRQSVEEDTSLDMRKKSRHFIRRH